MFFRHLDPKCEIGNKNCERNIIKQPYITKGVLSQISPLICHRKFPSLCLCTNFNVKYGRLLRLLFLNISSSLLILYSLARKLRYGIEKKRVDQFQSFDLLYYISTSLTAFFVFFSTPFSRHAKSDDDRFSASFPNNFVSRSLKLCSLLYLPPFQHNCHNG